MLLHPRSVVRTRSRTTRSSAARSESRPPRRRRDRARRTRRNPRSRAVRLRARSSPEPGVWPIVPRKPKPGLQNRKRRPAMLSPVERIREYSARSDGSTDVSFGGLPCRANRRLGAALGDMNVGPADRDRNSAARSVRHRRVSLLSAPSMLPKSCKASSLATILGTGERFARLGYSRRIAPLPLLPWPRAIPRDGRSGFRSGRCQIGAWYCAPISPLQIFSRSVASIVALILG